MDRRLWLGTTLVAALACQTPETPQQMTARIETESAAAKTAIEAQNAKFTAAMAAGQADQVAALYAEESHLMPPNEPLVHDRDKIQAYWAGLLAQGTTTVTLETEDVAANGPIAVELGAYTLSFKPTDPKGPMAAVEDKGKYMVHWHQEGGQWLISGDIWNSDAPAAMPAAAKK